MSVRVRWNIRGLRRAYALSLSDLSDRTREAGRPLTIAQLSKIERGERRVDVDDLDCIATALGIVPSVLIDPVRLWGASD